MSKISNISKAEDLVTTLDQTRKGFVDAALEKNRRATPYVENAKTLRNFALKANTPYDLLNIPQIRKGLLTASGLSDKSFKYFSEDDKTEAIMELIRNFLEPAGSSFVDELVYRFLLISGDSLGGAMRNIVGVIAQKRFVEHFLSALNMRELAYSIMLKADKKKGYKWRAMQYNDAYELADEIAAIKWEYGNRQKVLFFNAKITLVDKNVDICLYDCTKKPFNSKTAKEYNECAIMFGELKGGIDPAGADEHWKTGKSALDRIRNKFSSKGYKIHTSFIAAAIEKSMATEIFNLVSNNTLSYAANLTYDNQLSDYCEWIITLEKKR